jgi:glycosyltransferase involved in cell wall biosynthesis
VDGETGYLYDAGSITALAGHLDQLVSDREHRLAMGKCARKHIERNFSMETMVRRYEQVYVESLGK